MKQKKIINNNSKRTANRSFNIISFGNIHLNRTELLFQNQQGLPHTENLFLRI